MGNGRGRLGWLARGRRREHLEGWQRSEQPCCGRGGRPGTPSRMGADAGQMGPTGRGRGEGGAGRRDHLPARGGGTHRGVLPVEDDLRDVLHRVQEVIVSPLVPVDGHRAVFVHAVRHVPSHPRGHRPHLSATTHPHRPPGEPRAGVWPPGDHGRCPCPGGEGARWLHIPLGTDMGM